MIITYTELQEDTRFFYNILNKTYGMIVGMSETRTIKELIQDCENECIKRDLKNLIK